MDFMLVNMDYQRNGTIKYNAQKLKFLIVFTSLRHHNLCCSFSSLFRETLSRMPRPRDVHHPGVEGSGTKAVKRSKRPVTRRSRTTMDDQVKIVIRALVEGTDGANPLSPSTQQAIMLAREGYRKPRLIRWMRMIDPEYGGLALYMFQDGYIDSLTIRVAALCDKIARYGQLQPLVMLDGHGRTLFLVIRNLISRGFSPEDIAGKITLVDSSEGAAMWHRAFVPDEIEKIEEDVFETYWRDRLSNPERGTFFYFNFCGIGNGESEERTKEKCDMLMQIMDVDSEVMLSFSLARAAKVSAPIQELKAFCDSDCELVDDGRGEDFPTYIARK